MTTRKNVTKENSTQRKALLAIAFAGGILNCSLPAISETDRKTESDSDSVIRQIANSTIMTPEVRAFYLLKLASVCLAGTKKGAAETQFATVANNQGQNQNAISARWETFLIPWAPLPTFQSTDNETKTFADTATQMAITQLEKSSDKFAKLNMFFIGSQLFQHLGNTDGIRKCNRVLEESFLSCEGNSEIDEEQIRAASSVLNVIANTIVPVRVPQISEWERQLQVKPFTEKEFKESELLKLRAIAMVDRLNSQSHVRRKAHRDLSLWYAQLGKNDLAEKEKQILFELVGSKDDSILYPQSAGCGHIVWWETKIKNSPFCGMG